MSKPAQKIVLKPRNAERGTKGIPVAAAWPNDWNGYSWKLEEGWKLVSPEGEEYTTGRDGNAYLNGYDNERERRAKEAEPVNYGDDGRPLYEDEDSPF